MCFFGAIVLIDKKQIQHVLMVEQVYNKQQLQVHANNFNLWVPCLWYSALSAVTLHTFYW